MRKMIAGLLLLTTFVVQAQNNNAMENTIYQFKVTDIEGTPLISRN